jgi:hypothetical protein
VRKFACCEEILKEKKRPSISRLQYLISFCNIVRELFIASCVVGHDPDDMPTFQNKMPPP